MVHARQRQAEANVVPGLDQGVDALDTGDGLPDASEHGAVRVRHGDIHDRRPAFRHDVRLRLQDLSVLHLQESCLRQRDVEPDLPLDLLEPVIGDDEEGRARRQPGLFDRVDDLGDLRIEVRHRRHRRRRARAVSMLRGVEVEEVKHHEVRLVLADDVRRCLGPDVIAPDDVACGKRLELRLRKNAGLDELLGDPAVGRRALGKLPGHGRRRLNRHPVHLRRRQAPRVRDVVEGLDADHLVTREPRLDDRWNTWIPPEQAIEEHTVLRGRDAGDERRVVRPRDGRIHGPHSPGDGAASREPPQRRNRQERIVERPTREPVEADEDDMAGSARRRGRLRT